MLIDRIAMATCIACLQNGLLYILLPMLGAVAFGMSGMWAGYVVAPILTLVCAYLFIYLRFGKANFPFLLNDMKSEIMVLDSTLTPETAAGLSERVRSSLLAHQYAKKTANNAALFIEEMGLTILEKNKAAKKPVQIELSLFFEEKAVVIIERDSGILFDLTQSDIQIGDLSGFILRGLMEASKENAYLVTTGYNRNMISFARE